MALPPHLQRYDGLLDLLVEALLREAAEESATLQTTTPAQSGEMVLRRRLESSSAENAERPPKG